MFLKKTNLFPLQNYFFFDTWKLWNSIHKNDSIITFDRLILILVSQQQLNEKLLLQEFFFMIHHKQINIMHKINANENNHLDMKLNFSLNPVNGIISRLKQLSSSHIWIIVYDTANSGNRNRSSIFLIDKLLIQLLFISQVRKRNDERSMTIEVYNCFP